MTMTWETMKVKKYTDKVLVSCCRKDRDLVISPTTLGLTPHSISAEIGRYIINYIVGEKMSQKPFQIPFYSPLKLRKILVARMSKNIVLSELSIYLLRGLSSPWMLLERC